MLHKTLHINILERERERERGREKHDKYHTFNFSQYPLLKNIIPCNPKFCRPKNVHNELN